MIKLTGKADPQVISKFLEIWEKGTFFSQLYLKWIFFSEKIKVGMMKSPSTVVVCKVLVFLSLTAYDFKKNISDNFPFF